MDYDSSCVASLLRLFHSLMTKVSIVETLSKLYNLIRHNLNADVDQAGLLL